jgi:hypothetical protein
MSRFARPTAHPYLFKDQAGNARPVIALHFGDRVIYTEYSTARKLVDQIHDLCDDHERTQREGNTND